MIAARTRGASPQNQFVVSARLSSRLQVREVEMKMLYRLALSALVLFALAATSPARVAGDDVPAWLTQAAAATVPTYERDVPAVVLRDESQVTISPDGRVITTYTYAVRILTHEGRGFAVANEGYATDTGKVRDLRAWLIRPSGQTKKYGDKETQDVTADPNDVYDESRVKRIVASDDADAGAVFGYQSVSENRALFPQTEWGFQSRLPVLISRLTLTLPEGWTANGVTFNHAKVEPVVAGSTYTWELRDLAPIEPEVASPEVSSLAPRLAISYAAPQGISTSILGGGHAFADWAEVSRWYSSLADAQAQPDEAISAKVRELTANAKTELDKIRAIARYVQTLQYISIQIGAGRYRPHSAAEVFAKRYGDCKDKANLMRAMLKVWNIESYPVLIFSGDPTYVRSEWASPMQFNHCIVAVKVSAETNAPTVIEHPTLGRLLIFDATDDMTPVGDLPEYEQNSYALVAAGERGALLRMPSTPPEANRLERTADVDLSADGTITASLHERSQGQAAVDERRGFRRLARPDYSKVIESWITRGATGAKVTKVEPTDSRDDNRFALDVDFTAAGYGQLMQGHLLVFKPAIVSRREFLELNRATRKHAVVLASQAYTETVKVKLPAGFDVDELPDAVKLDVPFGTYSAAYEVKDGHLNFTRTFTQRAGIIPSEQYAQLRGFFERIRAAEQSPVVLAKK
jgi:transglutaminase-like putative cysteine protease